MSALLNPLSFRCFVPFWLAQPASATCYRVPYRGESYSPEQLADRRLRFTDDQLRRLAARAKELSRSVPVSIETIHLSWFSHVFGEGVVEAAVIRSTSGFTKFESFTIDTGDDGLRVIRTNRGDITSRLVKEIETPTVGRFCWM